jgi:uncharacterized protein YrrD
MDLNGLPVVTIAGGEAVADVKDVVYNPERGMLLGFTLNKRGFLKGPMKAVLAFGDVAAIGRDAVMIASDDAVSQGGDALADAVEESAGRNVRGDDVLTDAGKRLGSVVDVVLDVTNGEIVGYELTGDETLHAHAGRPMLVPLPATRAVSGTALIVPDAVQPFIRDDLSGFGAAVDEFRDELPKEQ